MSDYVPIASPSWLKWALKFKAKEGALLKGLVVAYRFDEEEGEWAVGTVGEQLTDEKDTVEVEEDGDEGVLTGHYPKNFSVVYAEGTQDEEALDHYLDHEM